MARLWVYAFILACLSTGAQCQRYDKFQALGFGIYTGGAPIVLGEPDVACLMHNNECKVGRHPDGTCLSCLTLNKDCRCDETTMECKRATGIYGNPKFNEYNCYLGQDDTIKDARQRISILEAAVERAHREADPDPKTLKIFNTPEFFFRGPNGSYPIAGLLAQDGRSSPLEFIAQQLDRIVQQKRFEHWLFIFGTVVASDEKVHPDGENKTVYLNVAPVFHGFDPTTSSSLGKRILVPKRYVSGIDFLTNAQLSDRFVTDPMTSKQLLYDNSVWAEASDHLAQRGYLLLQESWIYIDGIAFSIEVCLDHKMGLAQNAYTRLKAFGGKILSVNDGTIERVDLPDSMAQISLVTSSGTTITTSQLVLTSGGSIFIQDAIDPHKPRLLTCTIGKLTDGILGYSDCQYLNPDDIPYNNSKSVLVYDTEKASQQALDGVFSLHKGPPKIHVFTPQPIPEASASSHEAWRYPRERNLRG